MTSKVKRLKSDADRHFAGGRLGEALKVYTFLKEFGKSDPSIYQRIAEISQKNGDMEEAVEHYKLAIFSYGDNGMIVKAISLCKKLVEIDPAHSDIKKQLSSIYTKNFSVPKRAEAGADPSNIRDLNKKTEATSTPVASESELSEEELPMAELIGQVDEPDSGPAPHVRLATSVTNLHIPKTPLFSNFTQSELSFMIEWLKTRSVNKGEYVFKRGGEESSIYVITSGVAELSCYTKYNEVVNFSALMEGDFFGEFCFFTDERSKSSAMALTDLELLVISKDEMTALANDNKELAKVLFDFNKERVLDRVLAVSKIFRHLNKDERLDVLKRIWVESYQEGTEIFSQGDDAETMYILLKGSVDIWKDNEEGEKKHFYTLGEEGDFFGEVGLTTRDEYISTVTALTDTEVVVLSKPLIEELQNKNAIIHALLLDVAGKHASEFEA